VSVTTLPHARTVRFCVLVVSDATTLILSDAQHRLGDRITEHVTIAGIEGAGTWTVVERDQPHHLALETDLTVGHLRISYQVAVLSGGAPVSSATWTSQNLGRRSVPPCRPSPRKG
jgi:hypothetical protein